MADWAADNAAMHRYSAVSQSRDVRISARAARHFTRRSEQIAAACVEFIFDPLAENPYRVSAKLRGQCAGPRSARRGSYSVIFHRSHTPCLRLPDVLRFLWKRF
jgi:mRNA-degrading endonuclease RelE of RelBE toxin-antitoxin system